MDDNVGNGKDIGNEKEKVLIQFYESIIQEGISKATQGKPPTYLDLHAKEWFAYFLEEKPLLRWHYYDDPEVIKLFKFRKETLIGKLYDIFQKIGQKDLEEIANAVSDPSIDEALIWLSTKGSLEAISKEMFVDGFQEDMGIRFRQLASYIRPLIFLGLISDNKEKMPELTKNSSYLPHLNFLQEKEKKLKIEDIDKLIASILPDLFSDRLVMVLSESEQYIGKGSGANISANKYMLPRGANLIFTNPDLAKIKLDKINEDIEIKKEVYETLNQCLQIISGEFYKCLKSISPLKSKSSKFAITDMRYLLIKSALRNYVINQFLYSWQRNNFQFAPIETALSREIGIKSKIDNQKLIIDGRDIGGAISFYRTFRYQNTSFHLGLCVYILNKWYKAAAEYNKTTS